VFQALTEVRMPDKTLSTLVIAIIILFAGHDIDHFLRGDYGSGSPAYAAPVIVVTIVKYAVLGFGLFYYVKGMVGPGFWAILAGLSVALAWLAHFSPFTEQTPQFICRAYDSPVAGALAVAWLVVLMLVLVATMLYATVIWARASE
jgi:hypothetical protein